MNAIQNALIDIKAVIPPEILHLAFTDPSIRDNYIFSLDERITNYVIRRFVLKDLNIVGGVLTRVPLQKCGITYVGANANYVDTREFIVTVPKALTNGNSIVSVLSLVSNVIYQNVVPFSSTPDSMSAGMNMYNNMAAANVVQTARLELIGDNVIMVSDATVHLVNSVLTCFVENAANLENINPRYFPKITEMCLLAVKRYIYTNHKIKLNQGYIYNGHELGAIDEIINSYEGAAQEYNDNLGKYRKISFMNNTEAYGRWVKKSISNCI